MMHRALSTGVESGSSFRMTQLLLPATQSAVHDSGDATGRPAAHRRVNEVLPQPSEDDDRRLYRSHDEYNQPSWQTSVKLKSNDYQRLPQHYCSVYHNTNGQYSFIRIMFFFETLLSCIQAMVMCKNER